MNKNPLNLSEAPARGLRMPVSQSSPALCGAGLLPVTLFPWLLGEAPWSLIYNAPKVSLDVFKTRKKLLASVGVKSLQRLS